MDSSLPEPAGQHFDGHTEFFAMTTEQRLIWLSEIAKFVHVARECRSDALLNEAAWALVPFATFNQENFRPGGQSVC